MAPTLIYFIIVLCFGVLLGILVANPKGVDSSTSVSTNRHSLWLPFVFRIMRSSLPAVTLIALPQHMVKVGCGYFQGMIYPVGYRMSSYCRLNPINTAVTSNSIVGFINFRTFYSLISGTISSLTQLYLSALQQLEGNPNTSNAFTLNLSIKYPA